MLKAWGTHIGPSSLMYGVHRHLLTCLFLLKRCSVHYPEDGVQVRLDAKGNPTSGGGVTHPNVVRRFPVVALYKKSRIEIPIITPRALHRIAKETEIYYRPTIWLNDRVSFALGNLWAFLSGPPPELGFI